MLDVGLRRHESLRVLGPPGDERAPVGRVARLTLGSDDRLSASNPSQPDEHAIDRDHGRRSVRPLRRERLRGPTRNHGEATNCVPRCANRRVRRRSRPDAHRDHNLEQLIGFEDVFERESVARWGRPPTIEAIDVADRCHLRIDLKASGVVEGDALMGKSDRDQVGNANREVFGHRRLLSTPAQVLSGLVPCEQARVTGDLELEDTPGEAGRSREWRRENGNRSVKIMRFVNPIRRRLVDSPEIERKPTPGQQVDTLAATGFEKERPRHRTRGGLLVERPVGNGYDDPCRRNERRRCSRPPWRARRDSDFCHASFAAATHDRLGRLGRARSAAGADLQSMSMRAGRETLIRNRNTLSPVAGWPLGSDDRLTALRTRFARVAAAGHSSSQVPPLDRDVRRTADGRSRYRQTP